RQSLLDGISFRSIHRPAMFRQGVNSKRPFPVAPEDSRRILHLLLIHSQRITSNCRDQDFMKPYNFSGFSTRIRWRVASFGAHSASRSNSTASSGVFVSLGCGQLLPHTMRSGAACTYARPILFTSV